jgi:hypothetical protein
MVTTVGQQLQHAYQLIQLGKREQAANLLTVVLASDRDNADAWWLLAQAATDQNTIRRALLRVMELRPGDQRARQMLDSMDLRAHLAQRRTATHEMHAVQASQYTQPVTTFPTLSHTGAFPAAAEPALEEVRPVLQRRARQRRIVRDEPKANTIFRLALIGAVLFGLIGCAVLSFATLNGVVSGVRAVEASVGGFNPSLPAVAIEVSGSQPEQPQLGNVNALGSLSYQQFRTGAIASTADQHAYTFTGKAGDFVLIELSAINGAALDPALALYAPDRSLVGGSMDISAAQHDARLSLNLPFEGEYTIVISAQAGAGDYQVALRH